MYFLKAFQSVPYPGAKRKRFILSNAEGWFLGGTVMWATQFFYRPIRKLLDPIFAGSGHTLAGPYQIESGPKAVSIDLRPGIRPESAQIRLFFNNFCMLYFHTNLAKLLLIKMATPHGTGGSR